MAFFVPGLALREFRHIMLQGNCMKFTAFFACGGKKFMKNLAV